MHGHEHGDEIALFEEVVRFPHDGYAARYRQLVGLDEIKLRLGQYARALLDPDSLEQWSKLFHGCVIPALDVLRQQMPIVVFAGDVGTGKTALAESFGSEFAATFERPVYLHRMTLASRGTGLVGEMTHLISRAFDELTDFAATSRTGDGRVHEAHILVIDEADTLAQSRETSQMHHEDRAGVNALIRGLDALTEAGLPIFVVLCTNRLTDLDPAVQRRCAAIFEFSRPDAVQRRALLSSLLDGVELATAEMDSLVSATGGRAGQDYGYSYSDIVHRVVPTAILRAWPERALTGELLLEVVRDTPPTPPFGHAFDSDRAR